MKSGFSLPVALLVATLGVAMGLGGVAFVYGKGSSYLTDDPRACANCHAMRAHYDAWLKSSHHAVATCNDCHTPAAPVDHVVTKAMNGARHSTAFTLGNVPDSLLVHPANLQALERRCRTCHQQALLALSHGGEGISCVRCHDSVGHLL
jgi:cytochrome c nitrite reductase small subunit